MCNNSKIFIKVLYPKDTEYQTQVIFVTKKTFTDVHRKKCADCVEQMKKHKWIGGRSKYFADHISRYCTYSEKLFRWYLRDMGITYIHSWKNHHRIFDFYLPNGKLCIELDGKEYHDEEKGLYKDIYKRAKGMTIVRIDSKDAILYPREIINHILNL